MDLRQITPDFAVSPQINVNDVMALKDAGFTTVICNRPDEEVPPDLQAATLRAAVETAGMTFIEIPVGHSGMTAEILHAQRAAIDAAPGPVFAYCRSGTRSCIAWGLCMAGTLPNDEIIASAAKGGYDLTPYRQALDSLAQG